MNVADELAVDGIFIILVTEANEAVGRQISTAYYKKPVENTIDPVIDSCVGFHQLGVILSSWLKY